MRKLCQCDRHWVTFLPFEKSPNEGSHAPRVRTPRFFAPRSLRSSKLSVEKARWTGVDSDPWKVVKNPRLSRRHRVRGLRVLPTLVPWSFSFYSGHTYDEFRKRNFFLGNRVNILILILNQRYPRTTIPEYIFSLYRSRYPRFLTNFFFFFFFFLLEYLQSILVENFQ